MTKQVIIQDQDGTQDIYIVDKETDVTALGGRSLQHVGYCSGRHIVVEVKDDEYKVYTIAKDAN